MFEKQYSIFWIYAFSYALHFPIDINICIKITSKKFNYYCQNNSGFGIFFVKFIYIKCQNTIIFAIVKKFIKNLVNK